MKISLSPDALRDARDASGLSRQAVAASIGCAISSVQAWEKGWSEPSASVIPNLAALYGVTLESLFVAADRSSETVNDNASTPHGRDSKGSGGADQEELTMSNGSKAAD